MTFIRGGFPLGGGWEKLNFWNTGEWDVVIEHLRDLDEKKTYWCPGRRNLFAALDLVPVEDVKVIIIGQDPYPNPKFATGVAFSVPATERTLPPTLANMLKELQSDYPDTKLSGDLTPWCKQGVLLWNAYPTCTGFMSGSHHWVEWELLTQEILEMCSAKGIVVCFLGTKAGALAKYVNEDESEVLKFTHPSPLATRFAQSQFLGCRMFSTINARLCAMGEKPINWRLNAEVKKMEGRSS